VNAGSISSWKTLGEAFPVAQVDENHGAVIARRWTIPSHDRLAASAARNSPQL